MGELTERQKLILTMVIHEHWRTALPVGSQRLVRRYHMDCSSATVRNELAVLTEKAYLKQPYTSAGRVPTEKGYRLFVSGLMQTQELPEETRRTIEHQFYQTQEGMDGWMKLAVSILASQANAIALVSAPLPQRNRLKNTALISITAKQVLMVLVLTGGQMQQRYLFLSEPTSQSKLHTISERMNNALAGKTSEEASAVIRSRFYSDPVEEEIARSLLNTMYDADTMKAGEVYTEGINNVLSEPEFASSEEARRDLRILDEKTEIQKFLSRSTREQKVGGIQVFFGGEGILQRMKNCSMVIARYGMQGVVTGTIGILGPMRMAYGRNIPTVRFLAGILSDLVADTNSECR